MTPKHGHADDVMKIMEDLLKFYRSQPGFIDGYTLRSADEIGDVGRVTIWRTAADTDAAAQTPHVLSTRSDLLPGVQTWAAEVGVLATACLVFWLLIRRGGASRPQVGAPWPSSIRTFFIALLLGALGRELEFAETQGNGESDQAEEYFETKRIVRRRTW